jgi:hypothetical protein
MTTGQLSHRLKLASAMRNLLQQVWFSSHRIDSLLCLFPAQPMGGAPADDAKYDRRFAN